MGACEARRGIPKEIVPALVPITTIPREGSLRPDSLRRDFPPPLHCAPTYWKHLPQADEISTIYFFFKSLFALVSIFFLSAALSFPACSACDARALALRA